MRPFSISVSFGSSARNPSGPVNRGFNVVEKFARCRLNPWLVATVKRGALLLRPFFVKIWMTPFEASEPYSVAAAAPFRTSMRSMSSGFRSLSRSSPAPPLNEQHVLPAIPPHSPDELSTRTPSM